MMGLLVDRGYRVAFSLAWPIVSFARRFYRSDGVGIALWANDRLLVVRHSYKPGLSLPGGGLNFREDFRGAALRELREETGISLELDDLTFFSAKRFGKSRGINHLYEAHLAQEPSVTIDRREIIYAAFLSAMEIAAAHDCHPDFARYVMEHISLDKTPKTAIVDEHEYIG